MVFSKLRSGLSVACVIALAGWTLAALPAAGQDQQQVPADGAQPAPDQAAPPPAEAGGGDGAAPPAAEAPAQPQDGAAAPPPSAEQPQDSAAPPGDTTQPADSGAAQAPPAQPEQPAAEAPPAQPAEGGATVTASQIKIGTPVLGADGTKIGEINGVKSDDSGKVQEILVTDGVPAGMNAKVFEVPADKITSVGDSVKLSLSSDDAKKLPVLDNSNG